MLDLAKKIIRIILYCSIGQAFRKNDYFCKF